MYHAFFIIIYYNQQMHNAAYTIEYVLYMQSQTHTDYMRECNTENILSILL
jgi:hypothetical protein